MSTLVGRIWDRDTSRPLAARVQVLASTGSARTPTESILKHGRGEPFFYADGTFAVELASGPADILVERGTEYLPLRQTLMLPPHGTVEVDLPLQRWINLPEQGWYAGNTHIH